MSIINLNKGDNLSATLQNGRIGTPVDARLSVLYYKDIFDSTKYKYPYVYCQVIVREDDPEDTEHPKGIYVITEVDRLGNVVSSGIIPLNLLIGGKLEDITIATTKNQSSVELGRINSEDSTFRIEAGSGIKVDKWPNDLEPIKNAVKIGIDTNVIATKEDTLLKTTQALTNTEKETVIGNILDKNYTAGSHVGKGKKYLKLNVDAPVATDFDGFVNNAITEQSSLAEVPDNVYFDRTNNRFVASKGAGLLMKYYMSWQNGNAYMNPNSGAYFKNGNDLYQWNGSTLVATTVSNVNILTQADFDSKNTIYVIRYDYDLNNQTITIPENCTLQFDGGSLSNGVIVGRHDTIIASYKIFSNVNATGDWNCNGNVQWWASGCEWTNIADNDQPINNDEYTELLQALNSSFVTLLFPPRAYYTSATLNLNVSKHLILCGKDCIDSLTYTRYERPKNRTIIYTDRDITLLRISPIARGNDGSYSAMPVSIEGGIFDVSIYQRLTNNYTHNVIEIIGGNGSHINGVQINSSILGFRNTDTPFSGTGIYITASASLTAKGYVTNVNINSYISRFEKGVVVERDSTATAQGVFITDVNIGGYIAHCRQAIITDSDGSITCEIQATNIASSEEETKQYPLVVLNGEYYKVDGMFWDLGNLRNYYGLFISENTKTVSITGRSELLKRNNYRRISGKLRAITDYRSWNGGNPYTPEYDFFESNPLADYFINFTKTNGTVEVKHYSSNGTEKIGSASIENVDNMFAYEDNYATINLHDTIENDDYVDIIITLPENPSTHVIELFVKNVNYDSVISSSQLLYASVVPTYDTIVDGAFAKGKDSTKLSYFIETRTGAESITYRLFGVKLNVINIYQAKCFNYNYSKGLPILKKAEVSRFNTATNSFEYWNGANWVKIIDEVSDSGSYAMTLLNNGANTITYDGILEGSDSWIRILEFNNPIPVGSTFINNGDIKLRLRSINYTSSENHIIKPGETYKNEYDIGSITGAGVLGNYSIQITRYDNLENLLKDIALKDSVDGVYTKSEIDDMISGGGTGEFPLDQVVLKSDTSFAQQVTKQNTVYIIQDAFSLGSVSVTIPANSVLRFEKGSISNGSIVLQNTRLEGEVSFDNVQISGSCSNEILTPQMFGAKGEIAEHNNTTRDTLGFENLARVVDNANTLSKCIYIPTGHYSINKQIVILSSCKVYGDGNTSVIDCYGGGLAFGYKNNNDYSNSCTQLNCTITQDVETGDSYITLDNASDLSAGDYIIITDTMDGSFNKQRAYYRTSEVLHVREIEGNLVKLYDRIYGNYYAQKGSDYVSTITPTPANRTSIVKFDPKSFNISNINIYGHNVQSGQSVSYYAFIVCGFGNSEFKNINVYNYGNVVPAALILGIDYKVNHCSFKNYRQDNHVDLYGLCITGGQNFVVEDSSFKGGGLDEHYAHGLATGGNSSIYAINNRNFIYTRLYFDTTKVGLIELDVHANSEMYKYVDICAPNITCDTGGYNVSVERCTFYKISSSFNVKGIKITDCEIINADGGLLLYNKNVTRSSSESPMIVENSIIHGKFTIDLQDASISGYNNKDTDNPYSNFIFKNNVCDLLRIDHGYMLNIVVEDNSFREGGCFITNDVCCDSLSIKNNVLTDGCIFINSNVQMNGNVMFNNIKHITDTDQTSDSYTILLGGFNGQITNNIVSRELTDSRELLLIYNNSNAQVIDNVFTLKNTNRPVVIATTGAKIVFKNNIHNSINSNPIRIITDSDNKPLARVVTTMYNNVTESNNIVASVEDAIGMPVYIKDTNKLGYVSQSLKGNRILSPTSSSSNPYIGSNTLEKDNVYAIYTPSSGTCTLYFAKTNDTTSSLFEDGLLNIGTFDRNNVRSFTTPDSQEYPYIYITSTNSVGAACQINTNRMLSEYDGAAVNVKRYGTTSERPQANDMYKGFVYYDDTLNKPIYSYLINNYSNSTAWREADGAVAGAKRIGTTAERPIGSEIYPAFMYFDTDELKLFIATAITGNNVTWVPCGGGESGASTFEEITGDPMDNTNLATIINSKQDVLVSGTNIKTINGNDILGSGDIEISGGTPSEIPVTSFIISGPSTINQTGVVNYTISNILPVNANVLISSINVDADGFTTTVSGTNAFSVNINELNGIETKTITVVAILENRNAVTETKQIELREPAPLPEFVDLGLTDNNGNKVLWASWNIGASAPEGDGFYFTYGNIDGYRPENEVNFIAETYAETPGRQLGPTISNDLDAAKVYYGSEYSLPSKSDWETLIEGCNWTLETLNGSRGWRGTSKTNGNTIFLPLPGCIMGSTLSYKNTGGYYWSTECPSQGHAQAYLVVMDNNGVKGPELNNKYSGRSLRAVKYQPALSDN